MKDMHQRLKKSEGIKDKSIKELERLECENSLIKSENSKLRQDLREHKDEIKTLREKN